MDYIRFHRLAVKPKADMESILFLSSFRFLLQAMGALFPEQGKAATGLLPWPLQLTTYENQLDPIDPEKLSPSFQGDAADNAHEYTPPSRKINSILECPLMPPPVS